MDRYDLERPETTYDIICKLFENGFALVLCQRTHLKGREARRGRTGTERQLYLGGFEWDRGEIRKSGKPIRKSRDRKRVRNCQPFHDSTFCTMRNVL